MYAATIVNQSQGFDSKVLAVNKDLSNLKQLVEEYVQNSDDFDETADWVWEENHHNNGDLYVAWDIDPGYSIGILVQEVEL